MKNLESILSLENGSKASVSIYDDGEFENICIQVTDGEGDAFMYLTRKETEDLILLLNDYKKHLQKEK